MTISLARSLLASLCFPVLSAFAPAQEEPEPTPSPAQSPEAGAPQEPATEGPAQPKNAGFEQGAVGEQPPEWRVTSNCGGTVRIEQGDAVEGERFVVLDATGARERLRRRTSMTQSVDATGWRGKRVRLTASVRTDGLEHDARVGLSLTVMRAAGPEGSRPGQNDGMWDRPITDRTWQEHDIVLEVADDADRLLVGVNLMGVGRVDVDDYQLEAITDPDYRMSAREMRIRAATQGEFEPQQPFWTWWLVLPAIAFVLFVFGLWPSWNRSAQARLSDDELDEEFAIDTRPTVGAARVFAVHFAWAYWLLYCLPTPFRTLIGAVDELQAKLRGVEVFGWGGEIDTWHQNAERWIAERANVAGYGDPDGLVPPFGSGDTDQSYLALLGFFVLAALWAAIATVIWRRMRTRTHAVGVDLLRSYLRYVLAATMLGYGLAKLGVASNQFSEIGTWQLGQKWGDKSPMGVVWTFMGTSRAYTMFGGISEVLAALLLIWRRTGTLGALVTVAVMTNVVLLNFCYDVPVKQYSTHLLLMGVLILVPDARRLLAVFFHNRTAEPYAPPSLWDSAVLWWLGLFAKLGLLAACFGVPLYEHVRGVQRDLHLLEIEAEEEPPLEPEHRLTKRGFRWINQTPYNR